MLIVYGILNLLTIHLHCTQIWKNFKISFSVLFNTCAALQLVFVGRVKIYTFFLFDAFLTALWHLIYDQTFVLTFPSAPVSVSERKIKNAKCIIFQLQHKSYTSKDFVCQEIRGNLEFCKNFSFKFEFFKKRILSISKSEHRITFCRKF